VEVRIIIDTNRYRDFCEAKTEAVEIIRKAKTIFLPFVVLAELRAGFVVGKKGPENEKFLVKFINKPRVKLLYPDEDTTFHYAHLFKQLRTQATPIPTNDIWIAALAVQYDLLLFSRDTHFNHLPQLPLL
jgi:predicted nucleic acid-binding protein